MNRFQKNWLQVEHLKKGIEIIYQEICVLEAGEQQQVRSHGDAEGPAAALLGFAPFTLPIF